MRRHLLTLIAAGVLGALLTASEAQACCHKRACPAPTACVEPCPPPPPPPPPAPCPPRAKRCGLFHHNAGCGHQRMRLGGLCHKRQACPPAPCPVVYEGAPVYAAPQATPQAMPQSSAQGQ